MKGVVFVLKALYGKKFMGIERSTFIIDEDGFIIKIFRSEKWPVEKLLGELAAEAEAFKKQR